MRKFKFISASPGSGKTTWAINTLAPRYLKAGYNVLMVVPTIILCEQIAGDSFGRFKAIHSESFTDVINEIQSYFSQASNGVALVITEASFNIVSGRVVGGNWVVIKDEATEPLQIHTIKCVDSKHLLRSWLKLEPINGKEGHREIFKAISVSRAAPSTTTIDDDITGGIHRIKEMVRNPDLEILVDESRLNWKKSQLTYSVFTKPTLYDGFAGVYFMAANFEHTYLYHQWQYCGVEWIDKTPDELKQEYETSRVRLHYWSENGAWSRSRRVAGTNFQDYINWINYKLPDGGYIYVLNNSDANNRQFQSLSGERIPAVCHGLNKWRHITKFVGFASYLVSGHEEPFYQHYGTSTTDARVLRNSQMLYQQLTRTDLRNRSSQNIIDVYLPTLSEVRELLPYVPEATIVDISKRHNGQVTGKNGKVRNYWRCDSPKEIRWEELTPRYALGASTKSMNATCVGYDELLKAALEAHKEQRYLGENAPPNIVLPPSFSPSKEVKTSAKKWRSDRPIHPLIAYLKYCSQLSVSGATNEEKKILKANELGFFITGIVNDGARFTKSSIMGNNDIMAFDFDSSDLSVGDMSRIFHKLEYLRYTTISHDPLSGKSRFRLVLPCSRVMTISEHTRIMEYWKNEIFSYSKKYGKMSGLDEKCFGPERKFYVPHIESEIKHIYDDKEVMDVDETLARMPKPPIVKIPEVRDIRIESVTFCDEKDDVDLSRINQIISEMMPGDRSSKAVKIGGILKHLPVSVQQKEEIFLEMQMMGVSKSALNQARKYSQGGF